MSLQDYRLDEFGRKEQPYGKCPECGSKDIKVYFKGKVKKLET